MRKETVKVWSFNGTLCRHVTEKQAREMCAEDSHGNSLEGIEAVARRLSRKKASLADIKMLSLVQMRDGTPCTLTKSDMLGNAEGSLHPEVMKPGNYIDRAYSKVQAWPEEHDDRNTVISAGKAFGVFCTWPMQAERIVTFA